VTDDLVAGVAAVRATACRLPSQLNRIIIAPANGAAVLPAIVSGEAAWIVFVVNDSAQTIKVGAAPGETINGVTTATDMSAGIVAIPAGQSGIFVPVPNGKGGTLDWRSAIIP
jgi:hypothetical protein